MLALPQALQRLGSLAELNPAAAMIWAGSEGRGFEQVSSSPKQNARGPAFGIRSTISFVLTNVRGSRATQYLCGRRCLEQMSSVPIGSNFGYAALIFSYNQRLSFGLTADSMQLPDLDFMKKCVQAALDDLEIRAR